MEFETLLKQITKLKNDIKDVDKAKKKLSDRKLDDSLLAKKAKTYQDLEVMKEGLKEDSKLWCSRFERSIQEWRKLEMWIERRDKLDISISNDIHQDNEEQKISISKETESLAREWSNLWEIVTLQLAKIRDLFAEISEAFSEDLVEASADRCRQLADASRTEWKRKLLEKSAIMTEHPGPITRREKIGQIRVTSLKKSGSIVQAINRGSIHLIDDDEEKEVTRDLNAKERPGEIGVGLPKEVNPDEDGFSAIIPYNKENVLKLSHLKRTQNHGASSKLYHLEVRLKIVDDTEDMETFHAAIIKSRPFVITGNTNQLAEGWAAIFWENYLGGKKVEVSWDEFFRNLSKFFEDRTGRGLEGFSGDYPEQERFAKFQEETLKKTLMTKLPSNCLVTFSTFVQDMKFIILDEYDENYKENIKKENGKKENSNGISRWKYLYSYIDFLTCEYGEPGNKTNSLLRMWQDCVILGFFDFKDQSDWVNGKNFNCLIRFSNCQPSRLVVCFKVGIKRGNSRGKISKWYQRMFTKKNLKEELVSPVKCILQKCCPEECAEKDKDIQLEKEFQGQILLYNNRFKTIAVHGLETTLERYINSAPKGPKITNNGYIVDNPDNKSLWKTILEDLKSMDISLDDDEDEWMTKDNQISADQLRAANRSSDQIFEAYSTAPPEGEDAFGCDWSRTEPATIINSSSPIDYKPMSDNGLIFSVCDESRRIEPCGAVVEQSQPDYEARECSAMMTPSSLGSEVLRSLCDFVESTEEIGNKFVTIRIPLSKFDFSPLNGLTPNGNQEYIEGSRLPSNEFVHINTTQPILKENQPQSSLVHSVRDTLTPEQIGNTNESAGFVFLNGCSQSQDLMVDPNSLEPTGV